MKETQVKSPEKESKKLAEGAEPAPPVAKEIVTDTSLASKLPSHIPASFEFNHAFSVAETKLQKESVKISEKIEMLVKSSGLKEPPAKSSDKGPVPSKSKNGEPKKMELESKEEAKPIQKASEDTEQPTGAIDCPPFLLFWRVTLC